MKRIKKDELFKNLGEFLQSKGIALGKGSYAQRIRQGCTLLTDAINVTQDGLKRAKTEVDTKLDTMRQVIKKKTQPKAAAPKANTTKAGTSKKRTGTKPKAKKTAAKTKKTAKS